MPREGLLPAVLARLSTRLRFTSPPPPLLKEVLRPCIRIVGLPNQSLCQTVITLPGPMEQAVTVPENQRFLVMFYGYGS